jgi:hypothetical protein
LIPPGKVEDYDSILTIKIAITNSLYIKKIDLAIIVSTERFIAIFFKRNAVKGEAHDQQDRPHPIGLMDELQG